MKMCDVHPGPHGEIRLSCVRFLHELLSDYVMFRSRRPSSVYLVHRPQTNPSRAGREPVLTVTVPLPMQQPEVHFRGTGDWVMV